MKAVNKIKLIYFGNTVVCRNFSVANNKDASFIM